MPKATDKNTFVTLLPESDNFDLIKDIGQIPYTLNKHGMINAFLASSGIDPNGTNKEYLSCLPIQKLHHINPFLAGSLFILKNGRKVDCLNFYYGGRHSIYWSKLYKFLNPHGKVYIKLDMSYDGCHQYKTIPKKNRIFKKALSTSDLASVESEEILDLVKKITDHPVAIIPNGYIDIDDRLIGDIKRENKFITVGRLGTPEKATDILLEAFAQSSHHHDWILELVGPVYDTFKPEIGKFYNKYPEMKDRVVFKGPIYNKVELYREYRSARVFVLPSLWEGSPLVCPEALFNGCRLILSDMVPPITLFTNHLKYGSIVKSGSVDSLCNTLMSEAALKFDEAEFDEIKKYAVDEMSWKSICRRLINLLYI